MEQKQKFVRIFFKSKEADMVLKPMDIVAEDGFVSKDRILCVGRKNHHDICIPLENILYYETWDYDEEKRKEYLDGLNRSKTDSSSDV